MFYFTKGKIISNVRASSYSKVFSLHIKLKQVIICPIILGVKQLIICPIILGGEKEFYELAEDFP